MRSRRLCSPNDDYSAPMPQSMITCHVLLFAQLAESVGARSLSITLTSPATVADALAVLEAEHEPIAQMRNQLAFAVGDQYVTLDRALHDGDELSLIPPVSGG